MMLLLTQEEIAVAMVIVPQTWYILDGKDKDSKHIITASCKSPFTYGYEWCKRPPSSSSMKARMAFMCHCHWRGVEG